MSRPRTLLSSPGSAQVGTPFIMLSAVPQQRLLLQRRRRPCGRRRGDAAIGRARTAVGGMGTQRKEETETNVVDLHEHIACEAFASEMQACAGWVSAMQWKKAIPLGWSSRFGGGRSPTIRKGHLKIDGSAIQGRERRGETRPKMRPVGGSEGGEERR